MGAKSVNEICADWGGFCDNKISFFEERNIGEIPVFGFGAFISVPFSQSEELIFVVDFQILAEKSWDLGFSPQLVITNCDGWLGADWHCAFEIEIKILLKHVSDQ